MSSITDILKDFLPLEIAFLGAVFIYLLLLFKRLAEKFILIAEKQTTLAEAQAKYTQDRLDVVEKTLGISDKAFDLQEKRIRTLEALDQQKQSEIRRSQDEVDQARKELANTEASYRATLTRLNLQAQEANEIEGSHRQLQAANRTEAIVVFNHRIQTGLQVAIAHADNLKTRLSDSPIRDEIDLLLRSVEAISTDAMSFAQAKDEATSDALVPRRNGVGTGDI